MYIFTSIYIHHHQVALLAQISQALSIHLYHPLLPAGLPNYILCPHRTYVDKFLLVDQQWHVHVKGSIKCLLWARHCFSSSVLHVCIHTLYIYIYIYIYIYSSMFFCLILRTLAHSALRYYVPECKSPPQNYQAQNTFKPCSRGYTSLHSVKIKSVNCY